MRLIKNISTVLSQISPIFTTKCMKNLIVFLVLITITGCASYIRQIPAFPEVKILQINFPTHANMGEATEWTVWANACADCVKAITYRAEDLLENFQLLVQSGKFIHGKSPVSGLEVDWMSLYPGRFKVVFMVWNKWSSDQGVRWITVENKDVYQSWE